MILHIGFQSIFNKAGNKLQEMAQSKSKSISCCLRASGVENCQLQLLLPLVARASRVLGGTENNAPLLMFILEDALIAAKLRVELPEQFEEFFEATYPDGTVSSPQKAVAHWLQLSFDVANGKVSMQDPDSDREQQQGAGRVQVRGGQG